MRDRETEIEREKGRGGEADEKRKGEGGSEGERECVSVHNRSHTAEGSHLPSINIAGSTGQ